MDADSLRVGGPSNLLCNRPQGPPDAGSPWPAFDSSSSTPNSSLRK